MRGINPAAGASRDIMQNSEFGMRNYKINAAYPLSYK